MKKGMKALLALLFLIPAVSGALAADKTSKPVIKTVDNYVAVFDFEVTTGDKGISRPLADKVIHEFSMSDKYEVIDRGNMNKILKEQKFQMTGCVAQECKVEAGQILGVGKIVNGSVGIVGKTYYLTLQLIDVKTGKVELSAEDECRCEIDELLGSTKRLAKKLLGESIEQPAEAMARAKTEEMERVKAAQIAKAKAEAEEAAREKARTEAIARAKAEEAEKAKAAQIAKARAEAEEAAREKARTEAIAKAKAEEAERAKAAQIARAKAEEERIKAEQVARVKAEEERIKAERIAKAKAEERERAKAAQIAKARAEAEESAREKAKAEDTERAKAEQTAKARAEAIAKGEAQKHEFKVTTAAIDPAMTGTKVVATDGRFEKLASGVVRDTKNGLEWYAGPDEGTSQVEAKAWTEGLRIDGGGWRMPAINELKSLYLKGAGSRNMTPLLETAGWLVWSGETGVSSGGGDIKAWALDFSDGRETLDRRTNSNYMRGFAVRSMSKPGTSEIDKQVSANKAAASDGRFEKLASGVVRDTQSGIEWYAGPDKNMGWGDVKQWTAGLRVDGGGWRMPTIKELKGLYRKGAGPRNMTPLLETTGWRVWSGEAGAGPGGIAESTGWVLDFDDGREIQDRRDNSISKRGFAVRSMPESATAAIGPATAGVKIIASDSRFEKLASGVVRDTQSDLEWYAGPDKDTGWDDAKIWVAGLMIDGGGWRMPAIDELKSLYRKGSGSRNMTPLLETTGWLVWSGKTAAIASFDTRSSALDFDDGTEVADRQGNSNFKRGFAVRSTFKPGTSEIDKQVSATKAVASDGRFEKRASGVVRDTQNGLEWYAGPDKNTNWDDAKQWAAGLSVDGGDWRMPAIRELKGLYRKGAGLRNMTPLLETTGWLIWSGETGGLGTVAGNSGWALDFDNGGELLERRDNSIYKRGFAVRSRK